MLVVDWVLASIEIESELLSAPVTFALTLSAIVWLESTS